MVLEAILAALVVIVVVLVAATGLLARRLWQLTGAIECLCQHVSVPSARGEHEH